MRGTKKENRKSVRTRRAKRKFAFLKQVRRDTALSPSAKIVVWSLADGFYNLETEQCNAGFTTLGRAIGRSQPLDATLRAEMSLILDGPKFWSPQSLDRAS